MTIDDLPKEHWDRFTTRHAPATVAHVKSILGEDITQEAFVIAHRRYCKTNLHGKGRGSHSRELYKFLTKWNWITNPEQMDSLHN
jgi:hypothetical protein